MKDKGSKMFRFALGLCLLICTGCGRWSADPGRSDSDAAPVSATRVAATELLPFGNPSNATTDPANADNYLVVHDSHVLSYNNSRGTANWVAWRTTRADLGNSLPRTDFQPDQTLPSGFRRIAYYDYSGSGYDRGHMVPSADRFADPRLNEQTFLMTNIVPQAGDLNQFPWNKLESYSRGLARSGDTIYTIAGVYGEKERIRGKVTAPTNCWKVIVVLSRGKTVINASTRIIAVDMPNTDGIADVRWETYKTTVRAIEEKTGLDLFSILPRELQDTIETRVDPNTLHSP
jgi:endonuclease G